MIYRDRHFNNRFIEDMKEKVTHIKDLITRILPNHHDQVEISINDSSTEEYFRISGNDGKIQLEGSNPISVASALNWYLKYRCNCQISSQNKQMSLPEILPSPDSEMKFDSTFKFRYYFNYCTYSYTMPWWDWNRWEEEIDIMALNGVNLPLAILGQEALWQNVLKRFNVSDEKVFEFLPGPAYLAWGWLGNFDGWGGPTTQNWIDDQKELQLKILKRMRNLGITPVLQAFTGRVPRAIKELYLDAKIDKLPGWYGYEGVYFLDPDDPLFAKVNQIFLEEQEKLYGNDHFYAGDVFHEIDTPIDHDIYVNRIYKGIQNALIAADDKAQWILQSWDIRENNIDILDENHVIILDLFCDSEPKWKNTNAFHGHPWIWSVINNFGGRVGFGGRLAYIADELSVAYKTEDKRQLQGIGMAPEGLDNNPIIFDLLMEMNWQIDIDNIEEWVYKFVMRRYGFITDNIRKAWNLLLQTVFSGPETYPPLETVFCAKPNLNLQKAGSNGSTKVYYDNKILFQSLQFLIKDSDKLPENEAYYDDVVNVCRQVIANLGNDLFEVIESAYEKKNISKLKDVKTQFLDLILKMDEMMLSRPYFSLGSWLENARSRARNEEDEKLLVWNAKTQITLWSNPEITEFHDYANKQWGGLLKSYYYPRWELFLNELINSLKEDSTFDYEKINSAFMSWGVEWVKKDEDFPICNGKDSIQIVNELMKELEYMLKIEEGE